MERKYASSHHKMTWLFHFLSNDPPPEPRFVMMRYKSFNFAFFNGFIKGSFHLEKKKCEKGQTPSPSVNFHTFFILNEGFPNDNFSAQRIVTMWKVTWWCMLILIRVCWCHFPIFSLLSPSDKTRIQRGRWWNIIPSVQWQESMSRCQASSVQCWLLVDDGAGCRILTLH